MRPYSSPSEPAQPVVIGGSGLSASAGRGLFDEVLARGGVREHVGDDAWVRAMLLAEGALAAAGAEAGVVPPGAADVIQAVCRQEHLDPAALGRGAAAAGNPVVPLVRELTNQVRARGGEDVARWVHLGATSQDILDTATALVARSALRVIEHDLRAAADRAAKLARDHAATLVPARTLLQQALPTTFGLKAAGWLVALDDAAADLRRVVGRLPAQLGGAAGTLAALGEHGPAVAASYARVLGLAEPVLPWHTARRPVAEVAGACGIAAGSVAKIAGDVVLLAQTEVGEVAEEAPGRGGSSTLPHKANPVAAVAARAAALRAPGLVATLLSTMGQEHERAAGAWHAEWLPLRDLLVTTGSAVSWLGESLASLRVDPAAMRAALDRTHGLLLAERVTTELTPVLGRLEAHALVERACREVVESGRDLRAVLAATPPVVDRLGTERLDELLDPGHYLGDAPALVARALARHEAEPR